MKYPYQNLSLKNLPGEIWKDIPDYQDCYQLSNYGRIESLERWVERPIKGDFLLKEKIIKQNPLKKFNPFTRKYHLILHVSLYKNSKKKTFSTHRIVYYLFVRKFDLNDPTLVVVFQDDDNLNPYYKNLKLVAKSAVQIKTYKEKRKRKPEKIISCYNERGQLVRTYQSIIEASNDFKCKPTTISLALNGAISHCKGLHWKFGTARKIKAQGFPCKHVKRIGQYTLKGKLIRPFFSIAEAERITGYDDIGIRDTAKGRRSSYKGYKWKYV